MPDVKIPDSTSRNPGEQSAWSNPHLELIFEDISNREDWARRDRQLMKRRMCDRPKVKQRPYVGAPNFVVPIADDNVREKTDQEITMMENARKYGYILPLSADFDATKKAMAEMAFDSYLRYIINISDKLEEALDCKNSRGFAIIKVVRTEHERYRFLRPDLGLKEPVMLPDLEVVDLADIIVPSVALRNMQLADRITQVYRYSSVKFKQLVEKNKHWKNTDAVIEKIGTLSTNEKVKGYVETLKTKIGIVQGTKKANGQIVIYEFWHYATQWTVDKAEQLYGKEHDIVLGRKARMLFSPDAPDDILSITKWREEDTPGPYINPRDYTLLGTEKPWPYVQCRYENRSKLFYDCRGLAQLVMDDQIAASATRNAKHTMMDYYQSPQLKGPNRNSNQMTHEPGSFLPPDVDFVKPPDIPTSFDWTVDMFMREASKRGGVVNGYGMSSQITETRKVQKTAREVSLDAVRGDTVSSAAVNRFVGPWGEVFMQLWADLKRLEVSLPIIVNREFQKSMSKELYSFNLLIIPAANAKTLNPDLQFVRDKELWEFLTSSFAPMGVVLRPEIAARDMVSHLDPTKLDWLGDPNEEGPQGQQPVYMALGELKQGLAQIQESLQAITEAVQAVGELANNNSERLDRVGV